MKKHCKKNKKEYLHKRSDYTFKTNKKNHLRDIMLTCFPSCGYGFDCSIYATVP